MLKLIKNKKYSCSKSEYAVFLDFDKKTNIIKSIKIADVNAKSGIAKTVIVMGDSTTEQGYAMSTLYNDLRRRSGYIS